MVKRGSSPFATTTVAKGSVVLSHAVEMTFALNAEVFCSRHHILVPPCRLHLVGKEPDL